MHPPARSCIVCEREGAESVDRRMLSRQLETADQSLGFLVLILLSILLSFQAARIQREELARTLEWGAEAGGSGRTDVFPLRISASALVVGALGFFLCLALQALRSAGEDPVERRSASVNLWASVLVFLAALLRLDDLLLVRRGAQTPAADQDLPA